MICSKFYAPVYIVFILTLKIKFVKFKTCSYDTLFFKTYNH